MNTTDARFWKPSMRQDGVAWEQVAKWKAVERFAAGKIVRMANAIDLEILGLDYDGKKSPNGKGLCWWCRNELPKYRRTWCSDECAILYGWNSILSEVFKRDKGICVSCGIDADAAQKLWLRIYRRGYKTAVPALKELGWPCDPSRSFWEADHIKARSEDGEDHPRNLRTLCVPCHKSRTREQHKQWAARRRKPVVCESLFA